MSTQYRCKPLLIDAIRVEDALRDAAHNWKALPAWLVVEYDKGNVLFGARMVHLGRQHDLSHSIARPGDWIVKLPSSLVAPMTREEFALLVESEPIETEETPA